MKVVDAWNTTSSVITMTFGTGEVVVGDECSAGVVDSRFKEG